jgi:hypothetical protein
MRAAIRLEVSGSARPQIDLCRTHHDFPRRPAIEGPLIVAVLFGPFLTHQAWGIHIPAHVSE